MKTIIKPGSFIMLVFMSIILMSITDSCKPDKTGFVPPVWQVGDTWEVQYTITVANKFKSDASVSLERKDTARYEVLKRVTINNEDILQVEVFLKTTKKRYLLNMYAGDLSLQNVQEVFGTSADTLTTENYYGKESVLFTDTFGDFIADFHKFSNVSGQRVIQVGEEPQLIQNNTVANTFKTRLSATVDGERLQSVQTWENGKPWWTSALRKSGSQTMISGKLISTGR